MSTEPVRPAPPPEDVTIQPVVPGTNHTEGLRISATEWLDDQTEKRLDEIEMLGEEEAGDLAPRSPSPIGPALRYLHSSRTIHQLVTDRNRAVGLYLAVASLLWTASSALLNARPNANLQVPIDVIQRMCLPATFATLTVLALFVGFMLIRTRIGLIFEVAKMNVLLGLPVGRVKRVNPLSLFFLMHLLVSVAGGCAGGLFAGYVTYNEQAVSQWPALVGALLTGSGITLFLVLLYIGTVLYTTAEFKLTSGSK